MRQSCSGTHFSLCLSGSHQLQPTLERHSGSHSGFLSKLALVGIYALMHEQYCVCKAELSSLKPTFPSLPRCHFQPMKATFRLALCRSWHLTSFTFDDRKDFLHPPVFPLIHSVSVLCARYCWGPPGLHL